MGRMKKRGHGEGSIVAVKDRGWRGAVMLGRRPDGKPNRKWVSGASRREVVLKLNALIYEAHHPQIKGKTSVQ